MYKCIKCDKQIIIVGSEIIRACPIECANEPIVANASASMVGQGGVTN